MRKELEASNPHSCWNRADPREPVFVFLGRDIAAPQAIRDWCDTRIAKGINGPTDLQIVEAMQLADEMEAYRKQRNLQKV